MRTWPALLMLLLFVGCVLPPKVGIPPLPSQSEPSRETASRVIPVPYGNLFPRVLQVFMDLGFQIHSANRELGLVNASQAWVDEQSSYKPSLSLEATFLFQPEGPNATRVRMIGTGSEQYVDNGKTSATVSWAQPVIENGEAMKLLEALERRLCQPAQPHS